jgi:hypothetical protein
VADLFNRQHEAKFSEDQCGYGGRIRGKRVAAFLEEQGSVLLQGCLGVRPSPQLALPILAPTSVGAATNYNVPLRSMHARATPLPPATHHVHEAAVDVTVPTSLEIERHNRRECRVALDEIGWLTNGLLDDLRRKLLQHNKLKSALKKMRKLHRGECPEGLRTHDNDSTTQIFIPLSLSFPLPLFFPLPSSFF